MRLRALRVLLLAVAAAASQTPPRAAAQAAPDAGWPQWGGPTRDFKTAARGLAATWPASGPRQLWSRPLGDGYSAIVVDGGTLFTMYRPVKGLIASVVGKFTGDSSAPEVIVAMTAATGRTLWEHSYEAPFTGRMDMEYGPGPHSTPLVRGDQVYAVGVTGKAHALDRRTGKVVWARDLWGELGGKVMGRGYSWSPIAYGETVIFAVGGRGQALVALDRKDGSVKWKNHDFDLAPSSPLLINVDGQDQLVVFHASGIAGVDPAGGGLNWNHPHETQYGLNISTPVWGEGNLLFCSSAYTGGSRMLRLAQSGGKTTVTELWYTNKMRLHIGNALRLGGHVYGSSGDFGPAFVTAVDVATG